MCRTGVGTFCLWLCAVVCLVHGQTYVNVALDKTYNQSSKLDLRDSPSWAANNNTNGQYSAGGGNCIHTVGNDPNPWWEVDLGRTYPVHDITVWARTTFQRRLHPSDITVDGQLCASITSFPTNTTEMRITCSSVMFGRKVRITRQRDSEPLNLCEMQIWVQVCEDGYYRTSSGTCVQCSANCQAQRCDKDTGKCHGCAAGWYGDKCSTRCSAECLNDACQQSGECSCKDGYTGAMCLECGDGYYKTSSGTCVQCSANCQAQRCEDLTGKCHECGDGYYKTSSGTCVQCRANCQHQSCEDLTGKCHVCDDGYYRTSSGTCVQCSANCEAQSCEDLTGKCHGCVDGHYGDMCSMKCQTPGCRQCDQDTGVCTGCAENSNLQPPACKVKKDKDETVNTYVIVGAVVGTALFIGVCIIILGVVRWALRSRILSRQSRTTTDKPEVTASPEPARPAADIGQAKAVFQGVTDGEEHYEIVGDIPMTTKHVHPGTSTHPDSTSHVTEADNPYDLPAEQYSNTGELHLYDPLRVSRAVQPDDDINMTAYSDNKGKVPGEKGNEYEDSS